MTAATSTVTRSKIPVARMTAPSGLPGRSAGFAGDWSSRLGNGREEGVDVHSGFHKGQMGLEVEIAPLGGVEPEQCLMDLAARAGERAARSIRHCSGSTPPR